MQWIHKIWFLGLIIIIAIIVIGFTEYMHRAYYKHEHLYRTEGHVISSLWFVVICIFTLIVLYPSGLRHNIIEWHKTIIDTFKDVLPIVYAILVTILGIFITFYILRPNVKTSNVITYLPKTNQLIVNVRNNKLFPISGLQPTLYKCTNQSHNQVLDKIDLDITNFHVLEWSWGHSDNKCIEFDTKESEQEKVKQTLEEIKDNDNVCLLFSLSLTNMVSRTPFVLTKTYYKNDIIKGRFKGGSIYEISDSGILGYKVKIRQDSWDKYHSIAKSLEWILSIVLLMLYVYIIGRLYPHCSNCECCRNQYISIFEIVTICIYVLEIIRRLTDIRVPSPYNDKLSFINWLQSVPKEKESLVTQVYRRICVFVRYFIKW